MASKLITAPAAPALTLAAAKLALKIEVGDVEQDALIMAWIEGITDHAEHCMGRSLIHQSWRVTLDRFPSVIRLPRPPVASVAGVKYIDAAGVLQTLAVDQYQVDTESEPGRVLPAPGVSWPSTATRFNAVTVEAVCGYGATDTSVPKAIHLYLLAKLVEQFDPEVRPEKDSVQASFIDRLLDRYNVVEAA